MTRGEHRFLNGTCARCGADILTIKTLCPVGFWMTTDELTKWAKSDPKTRYDMERTLGTAQCKQKIPGGFW